MSVDTDKGRERRSQRVSAAPRNAPPRRRQDRIPPVSPRLLRAFAEYAQRYVRRHFHAVRLSRAGTPPVLPAMPLVIFLNHPSWWDPLVGLFLAFRYFPDRTHYAPVEAGALTRYRFFEQIGFFGIEPGTRRGGATLLRVGQAILSQPRTALWLTPAGQFTDPRERPVQLRPGIGHLAHRLESGAFVPLALEYPFWEERFPEALTRFGEPLFLEPGRQRSPAEWTALLARRLEATQDALALEARRRDRAAFELLLGGSAGVGGVYDVWRALWARLRGERFRREHGVAEL